MFQKMSNKMIPLYHVNTKVTVNNSIAEIKLEQFYCNTQSEFIETEYLFPSHDKAVFSELQMKYKDKVICTRIEERSVAKEKFEDAIASGKTAVMSAPSQLASDITVINLGNIPPKSEIVIECTFYLHLSVEDLSWCLYIPSKIIPRYIGNLSVISNDSTEEDKQVKEGICSEMLEGVSEAMRAYYQNLSLTYDFEIKLNSFSPLTRVISTTHEINTDFVDDKETTATIKLSDPSTFLDSDFKMLFRNEDINKPTILTEKLGNERALMISFLADLTSEDNKLSREAIISNKIDTDPCTVYEDFFDSNINTGEYYFVLDRSGSMSGQSIETAKKALILFLRSLPPGSKFNVISFGSDFSAMHKNAVDYDQENLESAIAKVNDFNADMGGTEIYSPLEFIFSKINKSSKFDKHVYLLTDGQIGNTDEVIKLIKENNSSFTVHAIGIGASVSTALVVGCSNAGKGNHYFVNNKGKGLEETVIEALSKSYYPYVYIKDQTLEWNGNIIKQSNEFKESEIKLVHGDQVTYYAIIDEIKSDKLEGSLKLKLLNPGSDKTECIEFDLSTECMEVEGSSLFKLIANQWIKESITSLDKESAISTSIKYQVPWVYTSFFAAEKLVDQTSGIVEYEKVTDSSKYKYNMTIHVKTLTGKTIDIDVS